MPHIGRLLELESLWLSNTHVSDSGAQYLATLTKIRNLSLDGTQITDAALVHLAAMEDFDQWLSIGCEGVTDGGLKHLTHLKKAQRISLLNSRVSTSGGRWLAKELPGCVVRY
jgi:internalin A